MSTKYPHVTLSRDASILACQLRGESHESLACLAANLFVALEHAERALASVQPRSAIVFNSLDVVRPALRAVQS